MIMARLGIDVHFVDLDLVDPPVARHRAKDITEAFFLIVSSIDADDEDPPRDERYRGGCAAVRVQDGRG